MMAGGLASGRSMVQIVEDMLELFRHDSIQVSLVRARVRAEDLIGDPFSEALVQARLKGIEMTTRIETGLPELLVDRNKISRVISNLLNNAMNFTGPGGKVHIDAEMSQPEPWMRKGASVHIERLESGASGDRAKAFVQFSVSDTGAGIPSPDLAYVFDQYWHSKREGAGTGLGLAVVKAHCFSSQGIFGCP